MTDKPKDRRINLFRIAGLRQNSPRTYFTEHEVIAECHFSGIAQFKNIEFRPWSSDDGIEPGDRRLYFLRFPGRIWGAGGPDILEDMEHGFHSGISDREEFVVLASVFLRRRLMLGATTKTGESPMRQERQTKIYQELTEKGPNLTLLPKFLQKVERLEHDDQHAFLLSSRYYHLGLSLSDQDPELAYLSHVSALEVLAHGLKTELDPEEVIDPELFDAVRSIPDGEVRQKTIVLLAETGKAGAFFRRLITSLTADSFFRTDLVHWKGVINRDNLDCVAKNIYQVRSKALHQGEPFPDRLIGNRTSELEEFPIGILQHQGKGKPLGKDMQGDPCKNPKRIPNLPAFERLTNHILLQFVETRTKKRKRAQVPTRAPSL